MIVLRTQHFGTLVDQIAGLLMNAEKVPVGEWHAQENSMEFLEVHNLMFEWDLPEVQADTPLIIKPNLPWAEKHFQERVSGQPLNPPPSSSEWPFAQKNNATHKDADEKFSHTYPERFWPKHAGHDAGNCEQPADDIPCLYEVRSGVRYEYGDLNDLLNLLHKRPLTRQAYLPVWFPEDTGAVSHQRVPCTLGYHFQIRNGKLNCTYLMRSCDFYRHFRDDVYMAVRLMEWIVEKLNERVKPPAFGTRLHHQLGMHPYVDPGTLTMHVMNMHAFAPELPRLVADALKEQNVTNDA